MLVVILLALLFNWYRMSKVQKENLELINSLQDTVKMYKRNNLNVSTTSVINTENVKDFLDIKSTNEEITKLQKVVKENKKRLGNTGSVTNFTTDTSIQTRFVTIVSYDTIRKEDPIYKSKINLDNWVIGNITAKKDSTHIDLNIKNEYSVIIGEESQGLFKPKKKFVEVVNYNPYSISPKVKTYQVKENKKNLVVGPYIGVGMGENLSPQLSVGIGITYKLLEL